jgi:hypothetical protein
VFNAPITINSRHEITTFDCGVESLNHWIKTRALKNQENQAALILGIKGIVVESLSKQASQFYTVALKAIHSKPYNLGIYGSF